MKEHSEGNRHRKMGATMKIQAAAILGWLAFSGCDPNSGLAIEVMLRPGCQLVFATPDEGKKILGSEDDFVSRLSPFDRAARMKTSRDVGREEYLAFVTRHVLSWEKEEQEKVASAAIPLEEQLKKLKVPFPEKIMIIKTSGDEEGGAAYTRGTAIILPRGILKQPASSITRLLCHELFHVLSRTQPQWCDRFYAAIGFERCDELVYPEMLRSRKLTNPDAPILRHWIKLEKDGVEQAMIPILFSRVDRYDEQKGGRFFDYLEFRFLVIRLEEGSTAIKPWIEGDEVVMYRPEEVSRFFEQVGRNTTYILHPEEILADNFALLIAGEKNLPSPEIAARFYDLLTDAGAAARAD